jgi:hypothetical protein
MIQSSRRQQLFSSEELSIIRKTAVARAKAQPTVGASKRVRKEKQRLGKET